MENKSQLNGESSSTENKKEVDLEKLQDLIVQLNAKVTSVLPAFQRIEVLEEENERLHQIVNYLVQEVTNLKLQRQRDNLENSIEILQRLKVNPGGEIRLPFSDTEEDITHPSRNYGNGNGLETSDESDEDIRLYTKLINEYEAPNDDDSNLDDPAFEDHVRQLREETDKIRRELEVAKLNTEKQYLQWLVTKVIFIFVNNLQGINKPKH